MSVASDDQLLRELQNDAAKWIMRTFPVRLGSSGLDEIEVRMQLKEEADKWVEYNFTQRKQGKEGTPSPDVQPS